MVKIRFRRYTSKMQKDKWDEGQWIHANHHELVNLKLWRKETKGVGCHLCAHEKIESMAWRLYWMMLLFFFWNDNILLMVIL